MKTEAIWRKRARREKRAQASSYQYLPLRTYSRKSVMAIAADEHTEDVTAPG